MCTTHLFVAVDLVVTLVLVSWAGVGRVITESLEDVQKCAGTLGHDSADVPDRINQDPSPELGFLDSSVLAPFKTTEEVKYKPYCTCDETDYAR